MLRMMCVSGLVLSFISAASPITIETVHFTELGEQRYRVDVSLRHADDGWDHYANRWWLEDENGQLLGERVLAHPHINEQPFTRSQTITIPNNLKSVVVKASENQNPSLVSEKLINLPK